MFCCGSDRNVLGTLPIGSCTPLTPRKGHVHDGHVPHPRPPNRLPKISASDPIDPTPEVTLPQLAPLEKLASIPPQRRDTVSSSRSIDRSSQIPDDSEGNAIAAKHIYDTRVNRISKPAIDADTKQKTMASSPGRLLATYPLVSSFEYCERLDCYVDSLDLLDPNIPGPRPPSTRKSEIFDERDYEEVDERAITTPANFLKQTLKELVAHLTAGYQDDLSRIRVIFRWITCQPVDLLPMPKEPPQSQAIYQLWRIKHKKGNYAQLVSLLCRYAQIPCVIIHGTLKGSTYEVGDVINDDQHYGEWNAVLVNGEWRFLNAYWGTCADSTSNIRHSNGLADDETNREYYGCDENYFLTDPDQVVATHLPKSQKWQLKERPVSKEEFEKMTFVKDRYFNMRLKTLSHHTCVVESSTGEVEITLLIPKHKGYDYDFQYLLFKTVGDVDTRVDRYLFIHRTADHEHLTMRVRHPSSATLRLELVGKDTTITTPNYDYDWIAIYKIIFHEGLYKCPVFPPTPSVGWGPGRVTRATGLVPLSHFTGEVLMDDYGKAEVKFGAAQKGQIGEMSYTAKVFTGGESLEEVMDSVVHRVENGDVIFNVMTPQSGEYVLRLFVKDEDSETVNEFCDYLLVSHQKDSNGKYPKGFQARLGPKKAFATSGMSPTIPSGYIRTEMPDVNIGFQRSEDIELSVNFSGENVKSADAPRLLSQRENGKWVTYTVRLPDTGQFGVKVRGSLQDEGVHEPLYDYVIDYRKIKKRTSKTPSIQEEAESYRGSENEVEEKTTEYPPEQEDTAKTALDILRRRMRMSIEESNAPELKRVLTEMRQLPIASVEPDIMYGEKELVFISVKRELIIAIRDKDTRKLKAALKKVKATGLEERLHNEVTLARSLLDRLKKLQRLLHAVLALDQSTILEIRGYSAPPIIVKTVMMATLLLLGHWEEDTKTWKNVQTLLGRTGKESLKRQIQEFQLETCPLEVAMGARDLLKEFSIEQVRLVSAGCATFYIWVKGVVEELEKRAGEEMNNIRPRTNQGRRKKELTFLTDLQINQIGLQP
ncbi:uncharacterized protein LOC127832191 isoform X2 [Dreissena polymorpha]|uniref:uncharacterized protein LOC127832191 isoform X2 n=1 Tax=Dreissena polymorpha TaxID=45954 RepID=UPI0022645967|nr:uncharacterized protein LOC127832191 isoform X2 [Dreissena polymorpha]